MRVDDQRAQSVSVKIYGNSELLLATIDYAGTLLTTHFREVIEPLSYIIIYTENEKRIDEIPRRI